MTSVSLHYSEELVLRTVRTFCLRTVGWRFLIALTIAVLCGIYLGMIGDRSWFLGSVGCAIVLVILFVASIYWLHRSRSLAKFRALEDGSARFECDDAKFRLFSNAGSSEMRWSAIEAVWCYPDFWLLFLGPGQFFTLPTADLSPDARMEILRCIQAHGIKFE